MKKIISIISVLIAVSLLSACGDSGDVYVSFSENSSNMDVSPERQPDTVTDRTFCNVSQNFGYDISQINIMNSQYTFDDNYLYLFKGFDGVGQKAKLNLKNGELEALCVTPGCRHSDAECIYNRRMDSVRSFGKEIRYISGNRLMSFESGKHTTLFTNNAVTQIGEPSTLVSGELAPGSIVGDECDLGGIVIAENTTYLYGGNIIFSLDNDTFTAGNPIKIGDNAIYSMCVYNDTAYIANDVNELYMVNIKTETAKKLGDKIVNPSVYSEKLYYIKWVESIPCLYSTALDGTNDQVVLEDCYVNYVIKDGNVFYSQCSSDKAFYMYSLDKKKKTKLSDIAFPDVVFAENIDRVFAVNDDKIQSWLSVDGSGFVTIGDES